MYHNILVPIDGTEIGQLGLREAIGERVGPFVISAAADWPAQLIVCGTHGRRGLTRMLLGSDAEYIVRHSSVPVLIVRSPPA